MTNTVIFRGDGYDIDEHVSIRGDGTRAGFVSLRWTYTWEFDEVWEYPLTEATANVPTRFVFNCPYDHVYYGAIEILKSLGTMVFKERERLHAIRRYNNIKLLTWFFVAVRSLKVVAKTKLYTSYENIMTRYPNTGRMEFLETNANVVGIHSVTISPTRSEICFETETERFGVLRTKLFTETPPGHDPLFLTLRIIDAGANVFVSMDPFPQSPTNVSLRLLAAQKLAENIIDKRVVEKDIPHVLKCALCEFFFASTPKRQREGDEDDPGPTAKAARLDE
jgi:hypothetical protein